MSKYYYPAVFSKEGDGYNVVFPDLKGCITCGDDLMDALEMAKDVLACFASDYEIDDKQMPEPSDILDMQLSAGEFANYIVCDTDDYRRRYKKISVKKTLTIPEWLNEAALARNVNFSQILQDALMEIVNNS